MLYRGSVLQVFVDLALRDDADGDATYSEIKYTIRRELVAISSSVVPSLGTCILDTTQVCTRPFEAVKAKCAIIRYSSHPICLNRLLMMMIAWYKTLQHFIYDLSRPESTVAYLHLPFRG